MVAQGDPDGVGRRVRPGWVFALVAAGVVMSNLDTFVVNVALPQIDLHFHQASLGPVSWVLDAYAVDLRGCVGPGRKPGRPLRRPPRLPDRDRRLQRRLAGLLAGARGVVAGGVPGGPGRGGGPVDPGVTRTALRRRPSRQAAALRAGLDRAQRPRRGARPGAGRLADPGQLAVGVPDQRAHRRQRCSPPGPACCPDRQPKTDQPGSTPPGRCCCLSVSGRSRSRWWRARRGDGHQEALSVLWSAAWSVLAGFAVRSARHPSPVLPVALLRVPGFSLASLCNLLFAVPFAAMLLSIVLWAEQVWHWSALATGFAVAPGPLMVPAFALAGRTSAAQTGRPRARRGRRVGHLRRRNRVVDRGHARPRRLPPHAPRHAHHRRRSRPHPPHPDRHRGQLAPTDQLLHRLGRGHHGPPDRLRARRRHPRRHPRHPTRADNAVAVFDRGWWFTAGTAGLAALASLALSRRPSRPSSPAAAVSANPDGAARAPIATGGPTRPS